MFTPQQVTVPNYLLKNWEDRFHDENENVDVLLIEAYEAGHRAGADQELEACCEWVDYHCSKDLSLDLRDTRRPKPPSLKREALCHLESFASSMETLGMDTDTIRRALEQLDD